VVGGGQEGQEWERQVKSARGQMKHRGKNAPGTQEATPTARPAHTRDDQGSARTAQVVSLISTMSSLTRAANEIVEWTVNHTKHEPKHPSPAKPYSTIPSPPHPSFYRLLPLTTRTSKYVSRILSTRRFSIAIFRLRVKTERTGSACDSIC